MTDISTVDATSCATPLIDVAHTHAKTYPLYWMALLSGILLPFGFAPFHIPGASFIGLAILYGILIRTDKPLQALLYGLCFGITYFGFGVSWIFVSIHSYGHLNYVLSAFITSCFILYLASFIGVSSFIFVRIKHYYPRVLYPLLFASLWVAFEWLRAHLFTGFPWLILAYGQWDNVTKHLLPWFGLYGLSFYTVFLSAFLYITVQKCKKARTPYILGFLALLFAPHVLKHTWTSPVGSPISTAIIQPNFSMRDTWDDAMFWSMLRRYHQKINSLMGTALIVLPESAIPIPPEYIHQFLHDLNTVAKQHHTALLFGAPMMARASENIFFNAMLSLGNAQGYYAKQHLVPFGEYIPSPFQTITNWLEIPDARLGQGSPHQKPIRVDTHPIASAICYEVAFPEVIRRHIPSTEWIVSMSDDGWFGHSLAIYQHQQIAQTLSMQVGRFQILANNDGLSSIINHMGEILAYGPAFHSDIIRGNLVPLIGNTPWIFWGDTPVIILCMLFVCLPIFMRKQK